MSAGQRRDLVEIAHAPFGIARLQALVEGRVARRGVLAMLADTARRDRAERLPGARAPRLPSALRGAPGAMWIMLIDDDGVRRA